MSILNFDRLTDAEQMLEILQAMASERKLRLFAIACARQIWSQLPDRKMRDAVEAAEGLTSGLLSECDRLYHINILHSIPIDFTQLTGENWFRSTSRGEVAAYFATLLTVANFRDSKIITRLISWRESKILTEQWQPDLLRDIFGDPYRPLSIHNQWLTPQVVSLARSMYESRDFSVMPSLAGMLQASGCESETILGHCINGNNHVRGCWVVDAILGRS